MSRYLRIALVLFYVLLTIFCCLLILILSGVYISERTGWSIVTGWTLYCFGSAWLFTDLHLYFARIRQPIRAEEEQLRSAFTTVSRNAGYQRRICLRVIETDEWNAFAIGVRTIAVSKAMLRDLAPNELEGVIAHELGHLISHDTIIAAAYTQARLLTYWLGFVLRWIIRVLRNGFWETHMIRTVMGPVQIARRSLFRGVIWVTLAVLLLYYIRYLYGIIALTVFVILFAILNRVVRFLDLLLSRMTEYRQDAYAQRLGFGKDLHDVLVKLAEKNEQTVRPYFIVFNSSHPVIYNRIRRLEQLEDEADRRRTPKPRAGE
jgi:Zn-dependent protease with chaperone function